MVKFNMRSMLDSNLLKKGTFQPVIASASIHEATNEIVLMLRPQAKARGINLHFKNRARSTLGNVLHYVDEMRVKQVLMNLLSNAIKFSKV